MQEGYLAKHAVSEEDKLATGQDSQNLDAMQGLEELDVAGPRLI